MILFCMQPCWDAGNLDLPHCSTGYWTGVGVADSCQLSTTALAGAFADTYLDTFLVYTYDFESCVKPDTVRLQFQGEPEKQPLLVQNICEFETEVQVIPENYVFEHEADFLDAEGQLQEQALTTYGFHVIEFSYEDSLGCMLAYSDSIEWKFFPEVTTMEDTFFCSGDTQSIALRFEPANGTWTQGSQWIADGELNIREMQSFQNYFFTYEVDTNGCSRSYDWMVTRRLLPEITLETADWSACLNEGRLPLDATPEGGDWFKENDPFTATQTQDLAVGEYLLTYRVTENGCSNEAALQLEINPLPSFAIRADEERQEVGSPVQFSAFNANEELRELYWWFGDGNESNMRNPIHTFDEPGDYEVRLAARGAESQCWDTVSLETPFMVMAVSREEGAFQDLKVYPNPFREQLTFESSSGEVLSITVYDINGKKRNHFQLSGTKTIATENWADGVYLIRLLDDEGNAYQRTFIKK